MFAYIPARIGSKRIPKKNIRLLDGKPMICHVIENLSKVHGLKGIAVSTDSEEIQAIVSGYKNVVTLALRHNEIATDDATFIDLIQHDLPRFQQYFMSNQVLFSLATSALIPDSLFQQGVNTFLSKSQGLVMSVKHLPSDTCLALQQTDSGHIEPLFPSNYAKPTKYLPKLVVDAGGFYIFNANDLKGLGMFIELKPITPVYLPERIGIDIDTEDDWQEMLKQYQLTRSI